MTYEDDIVCLECEQNGDLLNAARLMFEELKVNFEKMKENGFSSIEEQALVTNSYTSVAAMKYALRRNPHKAEEIFKRQKEVKNFFIHVMAQL